MTKAKRPKEEKDFLNLKWIYIFQPNMIKTAVITADTLLYMIEYNLLLTLNYVFL